MQSSTTKWTLNSCSSSCRCTGVLQKGHDKGTLKNRLPQEHQELSKHSHVCQFFAESYHDMDNKQLQQRLPLLWFDRLLRRFGPLLPLPLVALRAASDLVMLYSEQHQLSGLQSGRLQGHYTETAVIYIGLTMVRLLVYFLHCAGVSCISFFGITIPCCILSPYGCVQLPQYMSFIMSHPILCTDVLCSFHPHSMLHMLQIVVQIAALLSQVCTGCYRG